MSEWSEHVRKMMKKYKIKSYRVAQKDERVKKSYQKRKIDKLNFGGVHYKPLVASPRRK